MLVSTLCSSSDSPISRRVLSCARDQPFLPLSPFPPLCSCLRSSISFAFTSIPSLALSLCLPHILSGSPPAPLSLFFKIPSSFHTSTVSLSSSLSHFFPFLRQAISMASGLKARHNLSPTRLSPHFMPCPLPIPPPQRGPSSPHPKDASHSSLRARGGTDLWFQVILRGPWLGDALPCTESRRDTRGWWVLQAPRRHPY